MATPVARLTSIMTALIDAAPTNAQLNAVADAFTAHASDAEIFSAFGTTRDLLTSAQKATVAVTSMRRSVKSILRRSAEDAARVNADATVTAAGDAAEANLP